jgi:hypothetical protein
MIKKLIILFLATFLFIWSILPQDWYEYIGKKVYIEVWGNYNYEGIVNDVIKIDICIGRDDMGVCIFNKEKYTMFLEVKDKIKILKCEDIIKIEEINEDI